MSPASAKAAELLRSECYGAHLHDPAVAFFDLCADSADAIMTTTTAPTLMRKVIIFFSVDTVTALTKLVAASRQPIPNSLAGC
jgi:hypothetical protein